MRFSCSSRICILIRGNETIVIMTAYFFPLIIVLFFVVFTNSSETLNEKPKKRINKILDGAKNLFGSFLGGQKKVGEVENVMNEALLSQMLINATTALKSNEFDSAIEILSEVVKLHPENTQANKMMGSSLLALNQTMAAESFLYKVIESSKWTDIVSIYNLAECYRRRDEYDMAEKIVSNGLNHCADRVDKSGSLAYMLGYIHEGRRNYSQAADWYLMSAVQQVNNTECWMKASTLEFPPEHHDLVFAQNVLGEGLIHNPKSLDIMFQLGIILQQNRKFEEAAALYKTLLITHDDMKSDDLQSSNDMGDTSKFIRAVNGNLATALHVSGQLQDAMQYYERAIQIDNDRVAPNGILVSNYCILLCSLKDFDTAFMILGQHDPNSHQNVDEVNRAVKICTELRDSSVSSKAVSEEL